MKDIGLVLLYFLFYISAPPPYVYSAIKVQCSLLGATTVSLIYTIYIIIYTCILERGYVINFVTIIAIVLSDHVQ